MSAYAAGDFSLAVASEGSCTALPGQGADICRVMDGALIQENWVVLMPFTDRIEAGTVTVRYKGQKFSYNVTGPKVTVPLREILGHDHYSLDDDGFMQIRGTLQYKGEKTSQWVDVLGIGMLVVLQEGYSPLPVDSGYNVFNTTCQVQYATSGRSAVSCK